MRSDKILVYVLLGGLAILPLIALPFLGAEIIVAVDGPTQGIDEREEPDDGEPARLVSGLLVNIGGASSASLVAILDARSRSGVSWLCKNGPYLRDKLMVFIAENPNRVDSTARVPGRDPILLKVLSNAFPEAGLTSARMGDPDLIDKVVPKMDVYECSGRSYRRIASANR